MIIPIILLVVLLIAAEIDFAGPIIFFGSLLGYLWTGNFLEPVWNFTTNNVVGTVIGCITYIIIGACWSFFKWFNYLNKTVQPNWFDNDGKINSWHQSKVDISNNLGKVSTWVMCWPTSIIVYLLGDFLINIFKNVTELVTSTCRAVYENITNYVLNKKKKK